MASNRRPGKDERQRRNRLQREAREARAQHAGEATELARSNAPDDADVDADVDGAADDAGTSKTSGGKSTVSKAAQARRAGKKSLYTHPGQRAVVLALLFTIASAGLLLFSTVRVPREVPEDEVPAEFVDDADVDDDGTATYFEDGKLLDEETLPVAMAVLLTPIAITGAAVYFSKHPKRSTIWTFAMLALAAYVFFIGGIYSIYTLPALIAMGVGGFQARRDENKDRMAELKAQRAERKAEKDRSDDREVIDVDSVEDDDD